MARGTGSGRVARSGRGVCRAGGGGGQAAGEFPALKPDGNGTARGNGPFLAYPALEAEAPSLPTRHPHPLMSSRQLFERRIPTASVAETLSYVPGPFPNIATRAAAEKRYGSEAVRWAFAYPDPSRDTALRASDARRAIEIAVLAKCPHPRAELVLRMLDPGASVPAL